MVVVEGLVMSERHKEGILQAFKNGVGSTLTEKMRTRTAPKKNGAIELQSDKDAVKNMKTSERETMLGDEIGFLFPDSTMMYMMQESKKKYTIKTSASLLLQTAF